ncbi:BON domain-containing protein [Planctomyces sp. SH-PL14]|uniref:BON domain-containing protein n=1 Tax=Planctomyces sp. SH-PL14 TaxID=1632864 RepID=UPI00078B835F|nr:BON domain-containing protein [Planctomyces sp. SH-PL14]AMV17620.1 LysM domain/BON superfamily protein [Planctomyces sp. SH-PL14]
MRLPRKWVLTMGLLAAVPTMTVAAPFGGKSAESASAPSNQEVADGVKAALQAARPKGKGIQIEVRNGVASVSGQISDAAERARVTQVVQRVPGVSSVDNRLEVMAASAPKASGIEQAGFQGEKRGRIQQVSNEEFAPIAGPAPAAPAAPQGAAPTSNQEVAQNVADALASCGLSGYDIEIRYKNGSCSLVGDVEAREQAMAAHRAASSVPGVQNVINRLTVRGQLALPPGPPAGAGPRGPIAPAGYGPQAGYAPQGGYAPQAGYGPQGGGAPYGAPQGMAPQNGMMQAQAMAPGGPIPPQPQMGPGGVQPVGHHMIYNQPNVPNYAWPAYAQYDNYAAVTYPSQYDASAWPYMGPFYPYPQVPLNWRQATLEWDDGSWSLRFSPRTDKWWWFMNPHNWH